MLTPFGIGVRKLRLDKGLRLLDLAVRLKVSTSYLSAIETGRKPIPEGFVEIVADKMGLTREETEELKQAEDHTKKEVRLNKVPEDQRALVAAFARKVDQLSPEFIVELKKQIRFKSVGGEVPFYRKRRGLLVPPMSTSALRELADNVREVFVTPDTVAFPIMHVLEFGIPKVVDGFYLRVADSAEMDGEEGRVIAGEDEIILRRDVYHDAWNNDGRARFTACHELAHYIVHRQVQFARAREDDHPIYRDSEWQADVFAGALLMPARIASTFSSAYDAAVACGMTQNAAEVMLAKYSERRNTAA